MPPKVQEPVRNKAFVEEVKEARVQLSAEPEDRLFRSHGHTCEEIFALRFGKPYKYSNRKSMNLPMSVASFAVVGV